MTAEPFKYMLKGKGYVMAEEVDRPAVTISAELECRLAWHYAEVAYWLENDLGFGPALFAWFGGTPE
jgi:hypothetical protein